jgi:hypothetical protein
LWPGSVIRLYLISKLNVVIATFNFEKFR